MWSLLGLNMFSCPMGHLYIFIGITWNYSFQSKDKLAGSEVPHVCSSNYKVTDNLWLQTNKTIDYIWDSTESAKKPVNDQQSSFIYLKVIS